MLLNLHLRRGGFRYLSLRVKIVSLSRLVWLILEKAFPRLISPDYFPNLSNLVGLPVRGLKGLVWDLLLAKPWLKCMVEKSGWNQNWGKGPNLLLVSLKLKASV